jgi:peroxiredoxin
MKRSVLFLILLLAVTLTAAAGEFNAVVDIGAPMPSFTNLPSTDGTRVSSADLDEDVVVLVFLANHCPWVQGMDADLVGLVDEFSGENVRFVGISPNRREDDRLPAMKVHAQKYGYNFAYLFDESQNLGRDLGATRTPEYFVFDRDRRLVYMGAIHDSPARRGRDGEIHYTRGAPSRHYLREALQAMLAGEAVAVPETRATGCSIEYEN